jgi:hypothetical protein
MPLFFKLRTNPRAVRFNSGAGIQSCKGKLAISDL